MHSFALTVAALSTVLGCSRDITKPDAQVSAQPAESAAPKASHPADVRADEVLRIMARDYARALRVSRADWTWAKCHDEGRDGFAALLKCAEDVRTAIEVESFRVSGRPADAKEPCAATIETESRGYVSAQATYYRDLATWLAGNRARLEGPLRGRTMADACDLTSCAGQPTSNVGKYEGSDFYRVGKIDCTQRVFQCAPPSGNVCLLTKVGDRLGMNGPSSLAPVTVFGGSGRRVSLPAFQEPSGTTVDPATL